MICIADSDIHVNMQNENVTQVSSHTEQHEDPHALKPVQI